MSMLTTIPAHADWIQKLHASSMERHFEQPDATEITRAETLFLRVFQGETSSELSAEWSALGFELAMDEASATMIVMEKDGHRKGRGFFIFRQADASALQIPHAFKDEMTREIGIQLFKQGTFSAAAWNTVPRTFTQNGISHDADMAHLDNTYFIAFSLAFARHYPQGSILQIHGFAQEKRLTSPAKKSAAILSNGTRTPLAALRQMVTCLANTSGQSVLLYPSQVKELGATTNTIASALRALQFTRFFHLEMSRPYRTALLQSEASRQALLNCFQEAL